VIDAVPLVHAVEFTRTAVHPAHDRTLATLLIVIVEPVEVLEAKPSGKPYAENHPTSVCSSSVIVPAHVPDTPIQA
jgi:hypothetical protein